MMDLLEQARQAVALGKKHVIRRYIPRFHLSAPCGWLNDPNGFGMFNGQYHLFCQAHPYNTVWGPMHWGHWISSDLVYWQEQPIAMAPDKEYDAGGCFSGTAIEVDGKHILCYTGVSGKEADYKQQQCIAASTDGKTYRKLSCNPIIGRKQLPADVEQKNFRDPKIFHDASGYFLIAAAKTSHGGAVLAFHSQDLLSWKYIGIVADHLCEMAECPDLFTLNGEDVLLVSLIGAEKNKCFSGGRPVVAIRGRWSDGSFQQRGHWQTVDWGLEFYAPQTTQMADGRRIAFGWASSFDRTYPLHTYHHGWNGMMTVPREWRIVNGILLQKPLRELEWLRNHPCRIEKERIQESKQLEGFEGPSKDIELQINMCNACHISLRLMESKEEFVVLSYDKELEQLSLSREKCGLLPKGITPQMDRHTCYAPYRLKSNEMKLRILIDTSIIEVYAGDGETVMTMLAFPTDSNYGVSLHADAPIMLNRAYAWDMESIQKNQTCNFV